MDNRDQILLELGFERGSGWRYQANHLLARWNQGFVGLSIIHKTEILKIQGKRRDKTSKQKEKR